MPPTTVGAPSSIVLLDLGRAAQDGSPKGVKEIDPLLIGYSVPTDLQNVKRELKGGTVFLNPAQDQEVSKAFADKRKDIHLLSKVGPNLRAQLGIMSQPNGVLNSVACHLPTLGNLVHVANDAQNLTNHAGVGAATMNFCRTSYGVPASK